jgi:hypothetical protein
VEVERTREGGVTSANNRKSGAISHYDGGRKGGRRGHGDHIGVGGDIGGGVRLTVLKAAARDWASQEAGAYGGNV